MRKHLKKTTKRAMLASGLVGVAAVGVVASSSMAYANTNKTDLADAIAAKFKLNKSEVQQVIQDERLQHHDEHIDQLVTDGKLTQAQADKLKAKDKEMQAKREAAQNETDPTKRKADMEAIRAEMEQWAKDNGIDLSQLRPMGGRGPGGGHMGMGMMHDGDRDSDGPPAQ